MARERKKIYQSAYPQNPPEWYWVKGLHDACIVGVETIEFPFDYGKYTEQKNEYTRNALIFKVDSSIYSLMIFADSIFVLVYPPRRRKLLHFLRSMPCPCTDLLIT